MAKFIFKVTYSKINAKTHRGDKVITFAFDADVSHDDAHRLISRYMWSALDRMYGRKADDYDFIIEAISEDEAKDVHELYVDNYGYLENK